MDDEPVKATNDDASECKRCAAQLGYYADKYISLFVRSSDRKTPEINRGYYARVKGVSGFVEQFIKATAPNSQIINLGCGFDTLYWRLKDLGLQVKNFVEVDFPSVSSRKCYAIKRNKQLLEQIHDQDGEVKLSSTDLHAGNYHLMGVDLRNISEVEEKLKEADVDFGLPTLFLAECVLVYIEPDCTARLLSWATSKFKSALFVNYEMVNMNDIFGDIMLNNLKSRGCLLAGIPACKSLETQQERFLSAGWQGAKAWSMVQVYYALPTNDRQRIEGIEFLDEQELLMQLFQHYCICIAWQGVEYSEIDITNFQ